MNDDDDMVARCLAAGARGYVLKTDAEQHLALAIDALVAGDEYCSPSVSEQVRSVERPGARQAPPVG